MQPQRWLYHLLPRGAWSSGDHAPESLEKEGFVHTSYRPAVAESARLYFAAAQPLDVLQIDPRLLDVPLRLTDTPRETMPHIHGRVPAAAIRVCWPLECLDPAPDLILTLEEPSTPHEPA